MKNAAAKWTGEVIRGGGVERRRSPGEGLVDEIVDALSELDIGIGDAACIVSGEAEGDLGVADADIRVVLRFVCDFGEVVDEVDGVHEFLELDGAGDGVLFEIPFGAFLEGGSQFVVFEKVGHGIGRSDGLVGSFGVELLFWQACFGVKSGSVAVCVVVGDWLRCEG